MRDDGSSIYDELAEAENAETEKSQENPALPLCQRLSVRLREFVGPFDRFTEADPDKLTVLLVEDDEYVAEDYGMLLEAVGFSVCIVYTPEEAYLQAEDYRRFSAVVIDIRMLSQALFSDFETGAGTRTGLVLAYELENSLPDAIFFALTNSRDAHVEAWFNAKEEDQFHFCSKHEYPPVKFAALVKRTLRKIVMQKPVGLKAFIVHGHDLQAVLELKNFLQNTLKYPEPIILDEKASGARAIIEKFEDYAEDIDVVFVLMTPDDLSHAPGGAVGRARQNVLFELGYFVGRFGRKSGRVILLTKEGIEIPSDLYGMVPIDITRGVLPAGERIRRELEEIT